MKDRFVRIHPADNIWAALQDLPKGSSVSLENYKVDLIEQIPAKHKFTIGDLEAGDPMYMYGVLVGEALRPIPAGSRITIDNTVHAAQGYKAEKKEVSWAAPDVSTWEGREFLGYHRSTGQVGTRNVWLVIPMVFCENRNVKVIQEAMLEPLGYATEKQYAVAIHRLIEAYKDGEDTTELLNKEIIKEQSEIQRDRLFANVDGIKFLTHQGGCGGTREDSDTLCRLLAGYIAHPNVAGATVLSLGCQNAQMSILQSALKDLYPDHNKPVYYFEQQEIDSERKLISDAVKQTFVGLTIADKVKREPAPISKLCLGLECGGSDGFSGISANPALGYCSDLIVGLGGATILSEFPELNGVEQELIDRCERATSADKFATIMSTYAQKAEAVGSGFKNNPSPGNIKDGLITDAMKSAGAAKKGGTSPVTDVLDYTEVVKKAGLSLLCTPGNDVESTTGLAGSGANVIVFTTGLGTPTGNPICPVVKFSSNTSLYNRMNDIIDIDAGSVITGKDSIAEKGEELLDYIIKVASGEVMTAAEKLGQDDFIPWKRGVSL